MKRASSEAIQMGQLAPRMPLWALKNHRGTPAMTFRISGAPKWCGTFLSILVIALAGTTHAGEPPSDPMMRIDPGEHTASITRTATDDALRYLVTAANDKTARVWDLTDGRLLSTLRIPIGSGDEGKLFAMALSPTGQTVALGGWTQFNHGSASVSREGFNIFLFDRASGRLLRRISGLTNIITRLAFSPDGRSLAVALGAVVEGLNGKADYQKTGKITHRGLDNYVSERMKVLTKGSQSPVSIAPQGVSDFPIAVALQ